MGAFGPIGATSPQGQVGYLKKPTVAPMPAPMTTPGWQASVTQVPGVPTGSTTVAPNPQQMQVFNATMEKSNRPPTADPLLLEQVQNLRNRMSADTTKQAIGKAQGNTADVAAGAAQAARERASAQGTAGNVEGVQQGIDERSQRIQAGQATDITLDREKQLDALTLGGQGIMSAPGQRELTQTGMTDALLQNAGGQAGAIAGNQLGGAQLNLQAEVQRQAMLAQQAESERNAMLDMYRMLWA